jgi:predicted Zn-dependent protease
VDIHLNRAVWEDKVRKYSAPFAKYTNIYEATSLLQSEVETRWFVNTEGTVVQTSQPGFHLFVMATTKASDGMELPLYESYFAFQEKISPTTLRF